MFAPLLSAAILAGTPDAGYSAILIETSMLCRIALERVKDPGCEEEAKAMSAVRCDDAKTHAGLDLMALNKSCLDRTAPPAVIDGCLLMDAQGTLVARSDEKSPVRCKGAVRKIALEKVCAAGGRPPEMRYAELVSGKPGKASTLLIRCRAPNE